VEGNEGGNGIYSRERLTSAGVKALNSNLSKYV